MGTASLPHHHSEANMAPRQHKSRRRAEIPTSHTVGVGPKKEWAPQRGKQPRGHKPLTENEKGQKWEEGDDGSSKNEKKGLGHARLQNSFIRLMRRHRGMSKQSSFVPPLNLQMISTAKIPPSCPGKIQDLVGCLTIPLGQP